MSAEESAAIGASAHQTVFKGSDTTPGILFHRRFYAAKMSAHSVPASEHFTITSWGRKFEGMAYDNMLVQFPDGIVACVSDSYNIYEACEKLWGELLRDKVLSRNGVLVVRPNSGYPPQVVLKVVEILASKFGYSVNRKGYKVLNPKVRVIQGDGVDPKMIDLILKTLADAGWSADNVAFGMGGALLQKVNRDTMRFAFKCSYAVIDGVPHDVSKSPVDDPGKKSKGGNLTVFSNGHDYITADRNTVMAKEFKDITQVYYEKRMGSGPSFTTYDTLNTIRERLGTL